MMMVGASASAQSTPGDGTRKESSSRNTSCPHGNRRHYAKKMCMSCYHRNGRTKKAWACPHTNKLHYSKGMCQNCYLSKYYRARKQQKKAKQEQEAAAQAQKETLTTTAALDMGPIKQV
jgi:phosphorylcholine metabolism protein LicD